MGVGQGICCTQLCNRILFYFSFLRGRLYFAFGFDRCVGGDPIPQGCSPWNLGHFLLVQKVTKDTLKRRGIAIYLRAKSLAALGCAPKRACGRSPSPLGTSLLPTKKRASALFFDLFPGMQRGKVSAENHRKRSTHALIECGQRPQSTEIDTMPIEKSHPTLQPNAAQRAAEHRNRHGKIDQRRTADCTRPLSVSGARGERRAKDAPISNTICD